MLPKFLNTDEVAALTRLRKNFLEKLRSTGGGPVYYKPNAKCCVYRLEDVLDWLEQRRRANTAAAAA